MSIRRHVFLSDKNDIRLGENLLLVVERYSTSYHTEDWRYMFTFTFNVKRGCWMGRMSVFTLQATGGAEYLKCCDFFIPNNDEVRLHAILLKKLADREYPPALATQRIRKLRALID